MSGMARLALACLGLGSMELAGAGCAGHASPAAAVQAGRSDMAGHVEAALPKLIPCDLPSPLFGTLASGRWER